VYSDQKRKLQQALQCHADPARKAWWEKYVNGGDPFMGIRMADIRKVLHQWYKQSVRENLGDLAQLELALSLFDAQYTEEKLAGILFLQEILLPSGVITHERDIDRFAALFTSGSITDWNVCDWFCVKVLGPLIREAGPDCADRISKWRDADNLWQARASLVPFVKVAKECAYYPIIELSCGVLIRREERFAKTAVGWILREISKCDDAFVRRIIEENLKHFSAESLKNATSYFSRETRDHLKQKRAEEAGTVHGRPPGLHA